MLELPINDPIIKTYLKDLQYLKTDQLAGNDWDLGAYRSVCAYASRWAES